MKVCITTKTLARGGAEVLLSMVIPRLAKMGCEIEVLYFEKNVNDLSETIAQSGTKVIYVGSLSSLGLFRTIFYYRSILTHGSYDVIFEHSPVVSFFTRLFGFGKRIVYLEHSVWDNYNFITRFSNFITYRMINTVICCSEKVFESNGKVGRVVNNAVNITSLDTVTVSDRLAFEGYKFVVSVANISKVKNHVMLIDAFELLTYEKVKLVIVGEPRDNYHNVCEAIDMSSKRDDIILYGPSNNVFSILKKADIFCLTSLHEGLPISLLEAMSAGVVPISTRVGGIPSVINEECGVLIDDVSQLASAIDILLKDDEKRDSMSHMAINRIKSDFDIEKYSIVIFDILKKCIS